MKFNDMKYERPNMDALACTMKELTEAFQKAESAEQQIELVYKSQKVKVDFMTQYNLAYIRHSIDTQDAFYEQEREFFETAMPQASQYLNEFNKVFLQAKFREQLVQEFGEQIFRLGELEIKTFSPEIMKELEKENRLVSEYDKLIASAQIDFQGEKRTLAQLGPFMQDADRQVRKEANEAYYSFFAENETELDRIYDELVQVRTRMAHKLGYENYVQMGYDRLGRTDYNANDVANYRQQIVDEIVPITQELYRRQKERLGFERLHYYDTALNFKSGNAVPAGDPDWILHQADTMYQELSPETHEFFTMMRENELMDVLSRKGKMSGGYCTSIPAYKVPFIFANMNGTQHDVEVMTHEAGHAFQCYRSRNVKLVDYLFATYEAAEIHSMSMEFFTWPWMNLFFEEATDKFKFTHLAGTMTFLPYGALVDEFQHRVYEKPSMAPSERKRIWHQLEQKYMPHLDYSGNDYLERGGYWMRQGHIFSSPFYYIDYTLAQVCALQFWVKDREDHEKAWADYLRLCEAGGTLPFTGLVALANLRNPFENGTIASVTPKVKEYLNSVDDKAL